MIIRPRNFPYPVLTPFEVEDDNYEFSCELTLEENIELGILQFKVKFQLNNEVLEKLIREEKALFALHLECASTMKRLIFTTTKITDVFDININDLNKSVDINFLILSNTEIAAYENIEIDPYSEGFTFELVKGDTLAIGPPETLDIEKEPIVQMNSIFEIIPTDNKNDKPLEIIFSSEKIQVLLPRKNFELISYLHEATLSQADSVLTAIYYTPAIVETLYYIRDLCNNNETEIDTIRDYGWYRSIRARLHHMGIDIDELPSDSLTGIAHKMLDNPNEKAMKYIQEELIRGDYEA